MSIKKMKEALSESWEELPLIIETSAIKGNGKEELLKFIADTNKKL